MNNKDMKGSAPQEERAVPERLRVALDDLRHVLQMATPSIDQIHEFGPDGELEKAWQIFYDDVMPALSAAPVAQEAEPTAPAILEAISWHGRERDDLTLEEAVEAFRHGYKKVRQREDRAMLLQLIYLMASAPAGVAQEAEQMGGAQADDLDMQTIRERDYNAEMADKLAAGIAEHFGQDIGEHSSQNCPWTRALEILDTKPEFAPCAGTAATAQATPAASSEIDNAKQYSRYRIRRLPVAQVMNVRSAATQPKD